MRIDARLGISNARRAAGRLVDGLKASRRLSLAYQLRCAREDARVRGIKTPLGVWVCDHCPHVSFTVSTYDEHLVFVHA